MKTYLTRLCILVGTAVVFPANAQDSGLFRIRPIIAKVQYTLDYEDYTGTHRKGTSDFTAAGLGLSYIGAKRWFIDAKRTTSSNAQHDYWRTLGYSNLPLERTDTALTAGWSTESLLSMFATLQQGETVRTNYPTSTETKRTLTTTGIVVGAGKAFPTGFGTFSINGGLGYSKGNVKTTNTNPSLNGSFDADYAWAYSLGGAYSYQLHKNIALIVDARYQSMRMDFDASTSTWFYYKEDITYLGLNLAFQF